MFEKEAEEYLKKDGTKAEQILDSLNEISPLKITLKQFPFILAILEQTFKDGAEYGYNKALDEATHNYNAIIADYDKRIAELEKENAELKAGRPKWHKVADGDLPKEHKIYLVAIKENGLAIAYFNGLHWETKFNLGDFGHLVETVIAWCEIPTFDKE